MGGTNGARFGAATSPHRPASITLNAGAIDGFAITIPMGDATEAILGATAPPLDLAVSAAAGSAVAITIGDSRGAAAICPNRYIDSHHQRRGQSYSDGRVPRSGGAILGVTTTSSRTVANNHNRSAALLLPLLLTARATLHLEAASARHLPRPAHTVQAASRSGGDATWRSSDGSAGE